MITELTRQRVFDQLRHGSIDWSGRLDEVEFLGRLYDLEALPSTDHRHTTAAEDIIRHRVANYDWLDDWIFTYPGLGLSDGSDVQLLAFLAETLHPVVRSDSAEVEQLLSAYNAALAPDGYELVEVEFISGLPIYGGRRLGEGVAGEFKNLIFAAVGPKPEIVIQDALNNDVRIVRNAEHCLVYDRPIGPKGLAWGDLVDWWADRGELTESDRRQVAHDLYERLKASLANEPEKQIFRNYATRYRGGRDRTPALIPQVYLHYDPYTARHYRGAPGPLARQRMDFLLLLPNRVRVVIEFDGRQHYADAAGQASPDRYAAMVAEDRDLRLNGYEVYRFGGAEFKENADVDRMLNMFFDKLADRHGHQSV